MRNLILIVVVSLLFCGTALAQECSKDDAYNKLRALGRASGEMKKSGENIEKAAIFKSEIGEVGKYLVKQKYQKSCELYDALAVKYGIDLKEVLKRMDS